MQLSPRQSRNAQHDPTTAPTRGGTAVRHFSGDDLFGSAREVSIEHNQRIYRLRITAQGKLILTA
jgi:hemin uptake protein HemP